MGHQHDIEVLASVNGTSSMELFHAPTGEQLDGLPRYGRQQGAIPGRGAEDACCDSQCGMMRGLKTGGRLVQAWGKLAQAGGPA